MIRACRPRANVLGRGYSKEAFAIRGGLLLGNPSPRIVWMRLRLVIVAKEGKHAGPSDMLSWRGSFSREPCVSCLRRKCALPAGAANRLKNGGESGVRK